MLGHSWLALSPSFNVSSFEAAFAVCLQHKLSAGTRQASFFIDTSPNIVGTTDMVVDMHALATADQPCLAGNAFGIRSINCLDFLSDLSALQSLHLGGTASWSPGYPSIPASWNLTELTYLDLTAAAVSGNIPSSSSFPNLVYLGLGSNNFTGSIPAGEYMNLALPGTAGSVAHGLLGVSSG